VTALLAALVLAGTPADAQVSQRAQQVLAPFKKDLKQALTQAMKESPEAAIEVCATVAPALAKANSKDGVTVGRSALKLRNPKNAPAPWLEKAMKQLAKAKPGTPASKVVALPGGRVGYAEAIWTAEPCLTCHGAKVAPTVEAKLKDRYPEDQARGFTKGAFRGVFWAELDAPAKKSPSLP